MDLLLPFKIGDLAEVKCFLIGFRGAWFRCKILDMRLNGSAGYLEYYLEYTDYDTEQDKEWVRVFDENPTSSNRNSRESAQLMLRPSFPQWYYGHEVPEQFPNSDVTAIVDETWKVGDLVDWFTTGCYWSGTITKLLNKNMVEIKLPPPPIGEGSCYHANRNELRPTLEWSLTKGWTVPLSKAKRKCWHAARLLQHSKSESEKSTSDEESSSEDKYGDNGGGVQQSGCRASNMSRGGSVVLPSPSAKNCASSSSPKAQEDGTIPSAENLKLSSTSKPPGESEKSTSDEESSSDDEYGDNGGSVQQSGCRTSNMSWGGPVVMPPPSAKNSASSSSPKAQEGGIIPSTENLKLSSPSKPPGGTRVTVKQEPNVGISIKHEEWPLTVVDGADEFLEKLDKLQAKLDYLMERTQVGQERCTEVLASCRGPSGK